MPRTKRKSYESRMADERERQRTRREDSDIREQEQQQNTESHRRRRLNTEVRVIEQERDTEDHRRRRENSEVRESEQERNTQNHRRHRENSEFRENEQERDTEDHRRRRLNSEVREEEQIRNTEGRAQRRQDFEYQQHEHNIRHQRDHLQVYETLLGQFNIEIRNAPTNICCCCGGLFYKKAITLTKKRTLENSLDADKINDAIYIQPTENDKVILCFTCKRSLLKNRLPVLALANGHDFPEIPDSLQGLSPLEERLVALRLPFLQIRMVGCGMQCSLKGNVVNVENDLDVCAEVLPRSFNESNTIQVHLMRRMQETRPYWKERIRPLKVFLAAQYLVTQELYLMENVGLSDRWQNHAEDYHMDFAVEDSIEDNTGTTENVEENRQNNDSDADDNEDPENPRIDSEETMIYRQDTVFQGVRIAPGEGKTPIAFSRDPYAEYGSFPTCYAGKAKKFRENVKVTLTNIYKSELRNRRRLACKPTKLLYMYRRSFNEKVRQAVSIALRKTNRTAPITAADVRHPEFMKNIVLQDHGYSVFRNVRGTPSYWQGVAKDVMGMMRQLGKASFFLTLSAAETKWPELLTTLTLLLREEVISEEEAKNLSFKEKANLIRADPVTCMRHFDNRLRALLRLLLKSNNGVFAPNKLKDHFQRIEFQMRGSPHSHGLYWIEGCPDYKDDDDFSAQACCEFADQYITCERENSEEIDEVLGYQVHKHSQTCRRKKVSCRFGFPRPPMNFTRILKPLISSIEPEERLKHSGNFKKIHAKLEEWGRGYRECLEWNDFLQMIELNEDDYLNAIQSSIRRPTMFMKRATDACYINNYNRKLLLAWRANMDIQYVLNTYSCAQYCVSYVTKAENGTSKLLQAVEQRAKKDKLTIPDKLTKMSKVLMTGTEVSAQEAAGYLLGIPCKLSSRASIFVNTSPSLERTRMLRTREELASLDENSTDVFAKGIIERYPNRPEELADLCLAEFAAYYVFEKKRQQRMQDENDNIFSDPEQEHEENIDGDVGELQLIDGSGRLRRRNVPLILRFCHYSQNKQSDNAMREILMLFVPWQDEKECLPGENVNESLANKIEQNREVINRNSALFFHDQTIDDHYIDNIFKEIQHQEDMEDDHPAPLGVDNEELADADFNAMNDTDGCDRAEHFRLQDILSNEEYYCLMQSLNDEQRRFVLHVLNNIKTSKVPFYYFLSGGAGVGKSHVVKAIVQSVLRYEQNFPTENPDQVVVQVAAPTGKAAFNVNGMTLHSTFRLPPTQSRGLAKPLDDSTLNRLSLKLSHLKLLIIDEISMTSVKMLFDVDARMRQIFGTDEDFGGIPILVVGHLRQLPPVFAKHVFSKPTEVNMGRLCVNYLWERFQLFQLNEIMRQRGEYKFCKALNNMAEGMMDDEDVKLIKSREITPQNIPPQNSTWLFHKNEDCAKHNQAAHAQLNTEEFESFARDNVEGNGTEHQKQNFLEAAQSFTASECDGLSYKVKLKVNAQYFVSTNVDQSDGIFNGATGVLKLIEFKTTQVGRALKRIWIEFDNLKIGEQKRKLMKNYMEQHNINPIWTPIDFYTRTLNRKSGCMKIVRTQIPLHAANGMTIHKSQGSSIDHVVVHMGSCTRELLYVACSRATSLSGLYIDGSFKPPKHPAINDPVSQCMEKLNSRLLQFTNIFLQDFGNDFEKLYYQNINSFLKHKLDLAADHSAMAASIISLVEPHLVFSDDFDFNQHHIITRINCNGAVRNSEGVLALEKQNDSNGQMISYSSAKGLERGSHCLFLTVEKNGVKIITSYCHPKFSIRTFCELLESQLQDLNNDRAVFVGDINVDMMEHNPKRNMILDSFGNHRFMSQIEEPVPTHDKGGSLDVCFANFEGVRASVVESYYSDHKKILVVWEK